MKKIFFYLILSVLFVNVQAADWVKLGTRTNTPSKHFELLSDKGTTSVVHFQLNGFYKNTVMTHRGEAWLISAPKGAPILKSGAPDVPLFATSLIIPDDANMEAEVVSARYKEFDGVLIAPSKGNLLRTVNPDAIPYKYGAVYHQNGTYPGSVTELREPYILRDYRGQTLLIEPFQYNPVTKVLKVYYELTVKVKQKGTSTVNVLHRKRLVTKVDSRFYQIYKRHFLNFNSGSRYTPVGEHGNLLIISYGSFMNAMQPYVDWKIKTGTPVEMVDVDSIGSAPQIKAYIANYYNTNGLTFVLLVGDAPQVPASIIGGNDSDNDYGYVVGNDHYPDLFVGRFSAETEAQVNTMVERTLNYEQNPPVDTAWYTKAIGIGSDQGPGDDGEYDYQHIRNIGNNKLIPFTYNYAYELFDGSQGGNDAAGNPTPTLVADAINSGATIINYCGHGSTTSWGTSGFNNGNVNNLVNDNHLPFIFSVACVNGNFVNHTCFAEAWTRATHNGEPTGAIATIMSTINQSWNPPMCGQDEMDDILVEAHADDIKRTFGGIAMNGCMEMSDEYGSDGDEMTDTWTIFGDPALIIRTAIPMEMTVAAPQELHLGDSTMTVSTNTTEGTVCLSLNGVILGTASIDSTGSATLTFDPLTTVDSADFVITSFNFRPSIMKIPITNNLIPYLQLASVTINDANGNGQMDYNELSDITLAITNSGLDTAQNILTTLQTTNNYVTIPDSTAFYGDILMNDTVLVTNGFQVYVADSVPDQSLTFFNVVSTDTVSGASWTNHFGRVLHAPKLAYGGFTIDDSNGNNNGRIDSGETVHIYITVNNNGTSDAYNVLSQLTTSSPYITIESSQQNLGQLDANGSKEAVYQVTASGDAPDGTTVFFNVAIVADYNRSASGAFFTSIGLKPLAIVKLTSTEPSADSMMRCLQSLQVGCEIVNEIPANTSDYKSLFVLLGTFPNNHVLTQNEGTALAHFLNNGGRVYMEGADTWALDTATAVHPLFHILGMSDGLGDLRNLQGMDGSMMQGLQFRFIGHNNYIDRIAPDSNSVLLFQNADSLYGTAVSYENAVYKTVGFSFEFGGLEDSQGNEKEIVMAEILNFFNIVYTWTGIVNRPSPEIHTTVFPNPFSRTLTILTNSKQRGRMQVALYNLSGKKIVQLHDGVVPAGKHQWIWHADESHVQQGIYFVQVLANGKVFTKKVVLTR